MSNSDKERKKQENDRALERMAILASKEIQRALAREAHRKASKK